MKHLLQKILNFISPASFGEFPATVKGFRAAQRWAQSQPHSYSENLTLWEEVYDNHMDGYWVLAKINEQKRLADKYKGVKNSRKNVKKHSFKKS
jgi:hypothetical protein